MWRDLELLQEYEGFPFSLEWSTDKPEVLGASGRIYDNQKTGEVLLAAEISYGERKWQENVTVCVTPPVLTAQERIYEELEALLSAAEQDSRMEKEWARPAAVEGKEVKWEQAAENKGIILWIMALAAAGAVYFLKDRDLHERIEKRKRRMKREYPDINKSEALFDFFIYEGKDTFYEENPLSSDDSFYTPILPGWYSDPSICANENGDYFLVTSTFSYYPGVPIFHSWDLVNWKQIGHVLNRPSQLVGLEGQELSGGIFAPAIQYNPLNKTYYI